MKYKDFVKTENYKYADIIYVVDENGVEVDDDRINDNTEVISWQRCKPSGLEITVRLERPKIELTPGNDYRLPIRDGFLDISISADPNYPGIDIEYVSENEDENSWTRPRVVVENDNSENELRCLVWADRASEDFTDYVCLICPNTSSNN